MAIEFNNMSLPDIPVDVIKTHPYIIFFYNTNANMTIMYASTKEFVYMSSTKSFPSNSLASGGHIFLNFFLYLSPVPPCTVLEFTESQSMSNDLKNTFSNNFPEFQVG